VLEYYEEGVPGNGDDVNLIKQYVEKKFAKVTKDALKPVPFSLLVMVESLKGKGVDLEKLKSDIVKTLVEQLKLFLSLRKNGKITRKFVYFPSMELKESLLEYALRYFWDYFRDILRRAQKKIYKACSGSVED